MALKVRNRQLTGGYTMFKQFGLKMNLQLFSADLGVEGGDFADSTPADDIEVTEPTIDGPQDPPVDQTGEPPTDDLDNSKAFAKRLEERTQKALAEERAKWEQETSQKYGNYDQYDQALQLVLKQSGFGSFEELQQALHEAELTERAQANGVNPEFQQRIEQLEERAKRADELEQQQQQEQVYQQFTQALSTFASEKGIEANQLEEYMVQHNIPSFEAAYKALRHDQMAEELANAKDIAIKEYLASKKAPKVEGTGTPGVVKDSPPKTFEEARARAMERLNSVKTNE
jgi:hypothetical protein